MYKKTTKQQVKIQEKLVTFNVFNKTDFITSQAHSSQPELPTTSCSRTLLAVIQSGHKNKFIIQVMHGYR